MGFGPFGVHRLCLRLPYLSVFPFTVLHLLSTFTRVASLRQVYLHPSVDPSLTHFSGEFPGLGLALVPDAVVPEGGEGVRMKQKSCFKCLPWPEFESRTLQSNGR